MTIDAIFAQALAKNTPAERTAYLDEACADDLALRQRVETLLQSHEAAGDFLGKPAIQCAAEALAGQARGEETQGEAPVEDGDPEPLDFLTASDKPDSLGRLGHYEVLEIVGRGGMGIVLRAVDDKLHRVVAIKVMAAQLATNATAQRRFPREAQAAAAVTHDHIVTIHAVDEANGLPYLVMQFVSGMSLQERLDRSGPLELREIVRIGMQTAAGLAAAHAQGLIHRDIKPANILLENGVERVKITDFGLARAVADASLTQSGVVAGTPQYMSPEQARGEAVDQRTDLFSLGSVLYAMCAGRPPFRATTGIAVLKRVCEDTPSPLKEINAEIPAWLAEIVTKLHAKDPADRFESAAEVAELLNRHLAHLQHPSVVGPVAGNLPSPAWRAEPRKGPGSGGEGAVGQPAPRRRRWAMAAAALLLCVVAGLGFTEATGVTSLRATVIRVFTPEGTLIVEVDDPDVKVTIEGDGGIVITGAGLQEVRLKPGSYKVRAAKAGKPVRLDQELVTITRGDKQVVKVSLEPAAQAAATGKLGTAAKPVLLMHFDEADFYEKDGKTYVRDRSGNGNDGLCEQVQFTPQGKTGGGLANAGKGFLRLPSSLVAGQSHFTITAWVKNDDLTNYWILYDCLSRDYPASVGVRFMLQCSNCLNVGGWSPPPGDWIHMASPAVKMSPGEWTFVAVTLEDGAPGKGRGRLMLNDGIWDRPFQQVGGDQPDAIQDFAAGNLKGVLDELAVWHRALTAQELRELFTAGRRGPKS